MSAFVSDLLETRMGRGKDQIAGLEFFLSGPGFPGLAAGLPKRDELYDRRLFIDTNILIYALDPAEPVKRAMSADLLRRDDSEPYIGP